MKKEKEDDIKQCEERRKIDLRKDLERKKYYESIKLKSLKYCTPEAEDIKEKNAKKDKEEEARIQFYYDEKNRDANERAEREILRRHSLMQMLKGL